VYLFFEETGAPKKAMMAVAVVTAEVENFRCFFFVCG
jgi:hypothetical protein